MSAKQNHKMQRKGEISKTLRLSIGNYQIQFVCSFICIHIFEYLDLGQKQSFPCHCQIPISSQYHLCCVQRLNVWLSECNVMVTTNISNMSESQSYDLSLQGNQHRMLLVKREIQQVFTLWLNYKEDPSVMQTG